MLLDCILIMEKECEHDITSTQRLYGSEVQPLKKALSTITTGKLVNLIVDCMDTIRAKKNWNSHGAALGSAICQISSIISSLGKASEEEVRPNFNELIPHGVVHTGHKYGNTHSVCTEYMVSTHENRISVGGDGTYLNAERFNQQNHAEIVNKLFSEVVDGYPGIPAPRPTQTHTYDFGCTFMGVQFLDGECKDSATNADKGFLVLHYLDQLVRQDVALCMLMTSECFHFYRSMKNGKHIRTTHWQTNSYQLGQVGEQDLYEEDWLERPPTLVQEIPVVGNGGITMEKIQWSEHDPSIMECWKSLRSGLRMFLHTVSNAIDILVEHFSSMDLAKATKKRDDAFRTGWREPDLLSTSMHALKTRRMIINPERFLYSKANMNPNPIEVENRCHAQMEAGYSVMLRD